MYPVCRTGRINWNQQIHGEVRWSQVESIRTRVSCGGVGVRNMVDLRTKGQEQGKCDTDMDRGRGIGKGSVTGIKGQGSNNRARGIMTEVQGQT